MFILRRGCRRSDKKYLENENAVAAEKMASPAGPSFSIDDGSGMYKNSIRGVILY